MTETASDTKLCCSKLSANEVLAMVISVGGQIVVDENHRIDSICKQLSKVYRNSTEETIYTAIPVISYGRCPHCGGNVVTRERRINGNDTCEDGHVYPSRSSIL